MTMIMQFFSNSFQSLTAGIKHEMAKRSGYLSWAETYMTMATVTSQRSKDPSTQVGAVIVSPDRRIVSTGYNGSCNGISDDDVNWGKDPDAHPLNQKYFYVVHAEANAIVHAKSSCRESTIYVTHYPCHECAKLIIQAGVKRVVYANDWGIGRDTTTASRQLFSDVGMDVELYDGTRMFHVAI